MVWQASADQTAASVATIVGLISICNAVGRVLFGGMYDKSGRSLSMQLVNGLFILTSAVLLLAMSRGSVTVVILGFVLGGLAYSGVTPTNSAFCRAYFGPGHYPVNFPLINTNLIFASFGSTVSGALYDAGGSYNSTFFLIIGLAAVGIVCSLAISAIDKRETKAQNRAPDPLGQALSLFGYAEQTLAVFQCGAGQLLHGNALPLRQLLRHQADIGGVVALAPMGHRGHVGAVRLDEHTVQRRNGGHLRSAAGVL